MGSAVTVRANGRSIRSVRRSRSLLPVGGGTVEVRNDAVRAPWVKPNLVQKPLDETRSGTGTHTDNLHDFQS